MNAASKCASWLSRPNVSRPTTRDRPAIGLIRPCRDPEQRRLARPVRPDEPDPVTRGDRCADAVEDDERPDLAGHALQAQDRHQPVPAGPSPAAARAAARRAAAALRVRSVRSRAARSSSTVRPRLPSPASSVQRRPRRPVVARPGRGVIVAEDRRGRRALAAGQPLAERAEVRGADADDDAADGSPAASAGLAGPLVDVEPLLHRPVAIGRRVVVDRRAASLHRLGEDVADVSIQPSLVGRAQRARGPQRVEARTPQRLVGVDVADACEERLVDQQRLEPAAARRGSASGTRAP